MDLKVSHILWEGNYYVDKLASLGVKNKLYFIWYPT